MNTYALLLPVGCATKMPPKGWKKAPRTAADARVEGNGSICSFFTPVSEHREACLPAKKRGRPSKAAKHQDARHPGRKEQSVSERPAIPAASESSVAVQTKAKETRTNWGAPANLARLSKAMDDWRDKTGPFLSDMPEMARHSFAKCVGIPNSVLHKYMHADLTKRTTLGSHAGRPSLLKPLVQSFVVDVLQRRDRGNEGLTNQDAASMIVDLEPALTTKQASEILRRSIRPKFSDVLTNIIKAQASTTKRSAITVAQQYRWHMVCLPLAC